MTNQNGSFTPSFAPPGGGIALEEFWGTLGPLKWDTRSGNKNGKDWSLTEVSFPNKDIQIVRTREPFPWPIATIKMLYTDPNMSYAKEPNSEWLYIAEDIRKAFGRQPEVSELVDKRVHWNYVDVPRLNTRNAEGEYVDIPGKCWRIIEIQGLGQRPNPQAVYDTLAELADGKTPDAFYEAAFQRPEVLNDVVLAQTITERQILPTMDAAGVLRLGPDGILRKVGTMTAPNSIAMPAIQAPMTATN